MSVRAASVLGAVLCAWAAVVVLFGPTPALMIAGAALGLTALVGVPQVSLALLMATLSCDQVLNLHPAPSINLRLADLCAAALLIRFAAQKLRAREAWRVPRRPLQPLLIYLALACAGAFFSENLPKSVGYLLWAAADVFALFFVVLTLARTDAGFRRVRRAWVAGAVIAAGFGLVQLGMGFLHLHVPLASQTLGVFPRINGFNYEPAYYALYLESVASVYLARWVRGGEGAAKAGALGLSLLVPAALSMSRSGWLGMGLLAAYVGFHGIRRARGPALLAVAASVGVGMCALGLLLPARFLAHAPQMAEMAMNPREESSTRPRLEMVAQAAHVFAAHPVMGVGLGGYGGYVLAHPALDVLHLPGVTAAQVVTTNLWLETAAEMGVLGVGVLLWFLVSLLAALWRARRVAPARERGWVEGYLLSVGLVFFVLYQFNQTLWRLDVWVLLAMAWAAVARVREAQREVAR